MSTSLRPGEIVERARALAAVRNSDYDDEAETRRKLNAHGISDAEIARQLSMLSSNTANSTAVLTSYSLLHSLQHLDVILEKSPRRSAAAERLITIFRCAEICLYGMGVLAARLRIHLENGRYSEAAACERWRGGFQEIVYRLSALVVEVGADPRPGARIDIRQSRLLAWYQEQTAALQEWLMQRWPEDPQGIFERHLDDPQRFIFFNEFVNTSDERAWLGRLRQVRLPGVAAEGNDEAAFYARVVCSDDIQDMLDALETHELSDLLPFRMVHQVSEVMANCVNRHLCEVVEHLLAPAPDRLHEVVDALQAANRMLRIVDESIKLMMRALTPAAYSAIRPNLGMVRGTSSVVMRQTLFNATYPLMVRAFRLHLAAFDEDAASDDEAMFQRGVAILQGDSGADRQRAGVLREVVVLHQHIRTWRDNHHQLPKTHLGISPVAARPTVSLSGSDSAVNIAHELRKVHVADPVLPLYRAAFGDSPAQLHEIVTAGGFDEYMCRQTALAVFDVYADVQERFAARRAGAGKPADALAEPPRR